MADQLEPIHQAAIDGDLASINQLAAQDARFLAAPMQYHLHVDLGEDDGEACLKGCTPLMLAAFYGQRRAIRRLVALGADVGQRNDCGETAAHWACVGREAPALRALLGLGAPLNARTDRGVSPLMSAISWRATDCVEALLERGADGALELDARDEDGDTALIRAAMACGATETRLLLDAGADPTILNYNGKTALDSARARECQCCTPILEEAFTEAQRPRLLFKARTLLDAGRKHRQALLGNDHDDDGKQDAALASGAAPRRSARVARKHKAAAAVPPYLKGRVEQKQELPRVSMAAVRGRAAGGEEENETQVAAATLGFVLGAGEGTGLPPELFVEVLEMLTPKWDPARKGEPLGHGF